MTKEPQIQPESLPSLLPAIVASYTSDTMSYDERQHNTATQTLSQYWWYIKNQDNWIHWCYVLSFNFGVRKSMYGSKQAFKI